ncbi:MAG: YicC/YloC family endoribonuclease [Pirellulaceae bacterium]
MLLSMTGHGESRLQHDGVLVSIELRAINSRHFKFSLRSGDTSAALEAMVEGAVRSQVKRGTIQATLMVNRQRAADESLLDEQLLQAYRVQLERLAERHAEGKISIAWEALLGLPGVVREDPGWQSIGEESWPLIERALLQAVANLNDMRRREGEAMQRDLAANAALIAGQLDQVEERTPTVAAAYRERMTERLNRLLSEHGATVEPVDLVREVGVFAERCDVSEEVVRLRSHLEQFADIMAADESAGRKLDFVIQEMFREANTIGSKANDAEISHHVVEIKTSIERMREMVQNVE